MMKDQLIKLWACQFPFLYLWVYKEGLSWLDNGFVILGDIIVGQLNGPKSLPGMLVGTTNFPFYFFR